YRDIDIERLDPDVYSMEVMEVILSMTAVEEDQDPDAPVIVDPDEYQSTMMFDDDQFMENIEVTRAKAQGEAELKERQKKRYAEGTISREMLVNADGSARLKSLDLQIAEAFKVAQVDLERDQAHFSVGGDGELRSADGSKTYLSMVRSDQYTAAAQRIGSLASDPDSRVFAEEEISEEDLQ